MRLHTGAVRRPLRESALEADSGRKIPRLESASVLRLAFQSDALPAELFLCCSFNVALSPQRP